MRLLTIGLVAAAALLPAIPVAGAKEKPMQEWDGLVPKYNDKLENVWVRPNVRFKAYKRIRLPPVEVTVRQGLGARIAARAASSRNEEIENIRTGLAEMFHKEFAKHLEKGGYVITDQTAMTC